MLMMLALFGCNEYDLALDPDDVELGPRGPDSYTNGHPTRDTDADGIIDSEDDDADGDGVLNADDPDPDGDGIPGWTLDPDPTDDAIDLETGLPTQDEGDVRGRICAPNGNTWIAGATVQIVTPLGIYETTTNGDGYWQIEGLPPGDYTVMVWKGQFATSFEITVEDGEITEHLYDECVEQGQTRIAVVTGDYDSIGNILSGLGIQYDAVNGRTEASTTAFLTDFDALSEYDMIFFNCGMRFGWLENDEAVVGDNLERFVRNGGSIYASDWAYLMVETPFPTAVSFIGDDAVPGNAFRGVAEVLDAVVVDSDMANLLGGNLAEINYDLNQWATPAVVHEGTPLLTGNFSFLQDDESIGTIEAPLATRFRYGAGKVTYTSFHNETQRTQDMETLLQDIVLSL